ncbi:TPA: hypothetical protein DDZ86_00905 [Candidatus Dependentiae bacterium]|nr:MAG: hypothetical protein UW09_C0004G0063 [candidate division TM6 bacterium GW2011_GWF2_43_87]HBL98184.1 hypothetical protein [Candidatus Dependentiae bacterium]
MIRLFAGILVVIFGGIFNGELAGSFCSKQSQGISPFLEEMAATYLNCKTNELNKQVWPKELDGQVFGKGLALIRQLEESTLSEGEAFVALRKLFKRGDISGGLLKAIALTRSKRDKKLDKEALYAGGECCFFKALLDSFILTAPKGAVSKDFSGGLAEILPLVLKGKWGIRKFSDLPSFRDETMYQIVPVGQDLVFDAYSTCVAFRKGKGKLGIFDIVARKPLFLDIPSVKKFVLSGNGRRLAVQTADGELTVRTLFPLSVVKVGKSDLVEGLFLNKVGDRLLTVGLDKSIRIFNLATQKWMEFCYFSAFDVSPGGEFFVHDDEEGYIYIRSVNDGSSVTFKVDFPLDFSTSMEKVQDNIKKGDPLITSPLFLSAKDFLQPSMAVSSDGKYVAFLTSHKVIVKKLNWSAEQKVSDCACLKLKDAEVDSLVFSPGGNFLVLELKSSNSMKGREVWVWGFKTEVEPALKLETGLCKNSGKSFEYIDFSSNDELVAINKRGWIAVFDTGTQELVSKRFLGEDALEVRFLAGFFPLMVGGIYSKLSHKTLLQIFRQSDLISVRAYALVKALMHSSGVVHFCKTSRSECDVLLKVVNDIAKELEKTDFSYRINFSIGSKGSVDDIGAEDKVFQVTIWVSSKESVKPVELL